MPHGHVEVFALDGLDLLGSPDEPAEPAAVRPGPAHVWQRRHWVAIATAATVGVAAGAVWTDHHHTLAERATIDVQAAGQVTDFSSSTSALASVGIDARVHNGGRFPVRVLTTATGASKAGDVSLLLAGPTLVKAGQSLNVSLRVAVDCTTGAPGIHPGLRVRDASGRDHDVAILDETLNPLQVGGDGNFCQVGGQDDPTLEVALAGTLRSPRITMRNPTDQAVRVSLDPNGGTPSKDYSWSFTPSLPAIVHAGQTRSFAVTVKVRHCLPPDQITGVGYVGLVTASPDNRVTSSGNVGVDFSTLIGAAWQRACQ